MVWTGHGIARADIASNSLHAEIGANNPDLGLENSEAPLARLKIDRSVLIKVSK